MVEINKWRERRFVEKWSRQAAIATRGQIFNARWVDEQHKEKSRFAVKDFANTRDPKMFAAASDTAVGRVVEFKAVIQHYSMFTIDVTSAYTHAWEDELVFLEPPPEEIEEHGDCVWRSIRVICVRRKGGRSTLTRFSEARKQGSEVSQWNHIQSAGYFLIISKGQFNLNVTDMQDLSQVVNCCQRNSMYLMLDFLTLKKQNRDVKFWKFCRQLETGSLNQYLKITKTNQIHFEVSKFKKRSGISMVNTQNNNVTFN